MMLKLNRNTMLPCFKMLRKVALFGVGLILLMHSMLPHVHENELSQAEKYSARATADDFFDFLTLAFQADPTHFLDAYLLSGAEGKPQHLHFAGANLFCTSLLCDVLNPFFSKSSSVAKRKNIPAATKMLAGIFGLRAPPEAHFAPKKQLHKHIKNNLLWTQHMFTSCLPTALLWVL